MIGAYRMQYQNTNTYDMFQLDTDVRKTEKKR